MCVSGCPYKKIYYNWKSGKSEKCIFCYPRIEMGEPTVCSETCVGRIRYLGVMLYDADRIAEALDALHEGSRKEKAREHMIEAARDALVARGDDALTEVLTIWPHADRQMLRQLSRSAIDEQKKGLPPASARKLFRYLRSLPDAVADD